MTRGVGLLLLCLVLGIWFPLNFSAELATTLPSLGMRGPIATLELLAHGIVAATCTAAAWGLWNRSPHGPRLARVGLVAAAIAAVQSLYWSVLPSQTIPGDELPLSALAIVHSGAWLVYLNRSTSVRLMEEAD
jgi:hypothetical protein